MLKSKEHYDLMAQFEKDLLPGRLDKEPKELWAKGIVYQDGAVNGLFLAYRTGHSLGKSSQNEDMLSALQAIADMKKSIKADTDFSKLAALCVEIASITLGKIKEGK